MIFLLSATPKIPKIPGPPYMHFVVHFFEYLGFGLIVLVALRSRKMDNPLIAAGIICVLYGISDEVHQLFVPGRIADVGDVLADSLGSLAGIALTDRARRL